jgi:hypothetical protein
MDGDDLMFRTPGKQQVVFGRCKLFGSGESFMDKRRRERGTSCAGFVSFVIHHKKI